MSVDATTFKLQRGGQSGKSASGGPTYEFAWKVRCTKASDTAGTVLAWKGCPQYDGLPPFETRLSPRYRCTGSSVRKLGDKSLNWYEVTATYALRSLQSPLDKWGVRGGGATQKRTLWFDADGLAFRNSASDLLLPLPEWPKAGGQWALTIRRQSLTSFKELSWHTNASSIWGYDAETILIQGVSWRASSEAGVPFWEIDIPMLHDPDGHLYEPADAGWNYLDVGEKKAVAGNHPDHIDAEPAAPFLLDGAGGVLGDVATPVTGQFRLAPTTDFGLLNLPDPFQLPPP